MSACNLTHRGWGFSDSGGSEERLGDSDAFAEPEDLDMLVTAGVSVVACLLVPFLCWRHPQLTVPPGALQPHLAMLNACWTLVFIAGTLLSRSQRAIFQAQLLFLSDFFAVAMNVWDLVVLVDIFYVVQDPFRPSRSRWRYYVYVALVSLIVAGPVLVSEISEIRSMDSSDAAQLKLPGLEAARYSAGDARDGPDLCVELHLTPVWACAGVPLLRRLGATFRFSRPTRRGCLRVSAARRRTRPGLWRSGTPPRRRGANANPSRRGAR